jgi:hypothetical protein
MKKPYVILSTLLFLLSSTLLSCRNNPTDAFDEDDLVIDSSAYQLNDTLNFSMSFLEGAYQGDVIVDNQLYKTTLVLNNDSIFSYIKMKGTETALNASGPWQIKDSILILNVNTDQQSYLEKFILTDSLLVWLQNDSLSLLNNKPQGLKKK